MGDGLRARAGSHGQCSPDRGFFSCPIPQRQLHIVNLDGACCYRRLVQSKIVVTRPPPIFRPLDQAFPDGIQVHVFQPLLEFPLVAHKAIPKLVLPQRSPAPPPGVKPQRRDLLDVVQHLPDQKRIPRPDQGVPVVGHQNIAAEHKPQPSPRSLQHVNDQRVFGIAESPDPRPKVHVDKEDAVREAQTVNA